MEERKGFGSNFGFLMAAVGSAVGLGNIWGFPNKMGASGGFTFLIIYLILAVLCGFIVMLGELAIGRKTGKGAVEAYHVLSKKFKWMGWMGILSAFFILFFYCALGGYCIKYVVLNVGDLFKAGFGANAVAAAAGGDGSLGDIVFGSFIGNSGEAIIYGLIFVAITMLIVLGGVGGGIEKVCSVGMPALCVALLLVGVQEPERAASTVRNNPIRRENLRRLGGAYWWVVALGAVFTLARFSEAFLVLRVQQGGLPLAWTPLVLVLMNVVFALGAYPLGKLADSTRHTTLLAWGLVVLIAADALLAFSDRGAAAWLGIALWGLHMAMTQGLLATMVADTAPADLRGTAFGMFNLVSGVALLVASGLAGLLWDRLGASATFGAGILFATLALAGVLVQSARHGRTPKPPATQG